MTNLGQFRKRGDVVARVTDALYIDCLGVLVYGGCKCLRSRINNELDSDVVFLQEN